MREKKQVKVSDNFAFETLGHEQKHKFYARMSILPPIPVMADTSIDSSISIMAVSEVSIAIFMTEVPTCMSSCC